MTTTLIENVTLLTMSRNPSIDKFYPQAAILIRDDHIEDIGTVVPRKADRSIDGRGMLAMPGLINGHNHFEQSFMNAIVRLFPGSTEEWIRDFKIPITAAMEENDYYLSAMLTCLHLIKSGVTTSINHICQQSVDKLVRFGVDETISAISESGVRSVVPIGFADKNEPEEFLVDAQTYDELLKGWHGKWDNAAGGRVRIWPGPTGFFADSAAMWEVAKRFAREKSCGIHTHFASFPGDDVSEALRSDVLGPDFTGAHCVWLDAAAIMEMGSRDVKVVHNPTYKLSYSLDGEVSGFGDGIAPVAELAGAGCVIGLGQDGCMGDTQDMFKEMRALAFTQHYRGRDKRLFPPSRLLEMATIDCAKTMMWHDEIGSLEPGKKADIVLVDLGEEKFVPRLNLLANLVYQASAENVDTVIINGEMVMRERVVLTVDAKVVVAEAQEAASSIIDRAGLAELKKMSLDPWISGHRFP